MQNRAEINTQIRQLADAAQLDRAVADQLIDQGATIEQAQAAMFDALMQRAAPTIRHQRIELLAAHDDPV